MPNPDNNKNHGRPGAVSKDSVFFSIAPQPPAPRNEARPSAAPAVAPEQMTALKARLDSLEKNIAALIEQKLAAPAAVPGQVTALGTRLDSLEQNLTALVEKKLSERDAASSGIAEKREKELLSGLAGLADRLDGFKALNAAQAAELLKTLGERQKPPEPDQRLHNQLERSWLRVEGLEKKLEEAYRIFMEAQLKWKAEKKAEVETLAEFGRKTASLEGGFVELRTFIGAARAKDETALNESAARFCRRAE